MNKTTNTAKTVERTNNPMNMKTSCRGFVNAIIDNASDTCKKVKLNASALPQTLNTDYTLSYLMAKCIGHDAFSIENVKSHKAFQSGMSFDKIIRFDLRLNLDDCDIVLRVNSEAGKLFIGGAYATTLHCANGAFPFVLDKLYAQASTLGVAA